MHGLGNDFVVIDARSDPLPLSPAGAAALADRRRGIGCDTVTLIEPARNGGDVSIRFFNADGSGSGACGNATRCVAGLIFAETGKPAIAIETEGGRLIARQMGEGLISVDMGAPRFDWEDIPLAEKMDTRTLELQVGPIDDPHLRQPSAVNVGNPHCIFFVERAEAYDLERYGPLVENHPLFPEAANVSLAEIQSPDRIRLRVWERGVGITQACGTAACAAVAAAARRGMADRTATVELDGGELRIEWQESDGHLLMTGPWTESYAGTVDVAALESAWSQARGRPR